MHNCSICGQNVSNKPSVIFECSVSCNICGNYEITRRAAAVLSSNQQYQAVKHILSGVIREATENDNTIKINATNIQEIIDSASIPDSPFEKIDQILLYFQRHTSVFGSVVDINCDHDYPIAYAKNREEFSYLLDQAAELGYLDDQGSEYRLSLKGWERLDELRRNQPKSNQAFVAMWFPDEKKEPKWKKKLDEAWSNGFKPALEDERSSYKALRIDLVEHNEKICDRIVAEIRKSGLLVTDLTGNRGGVYFEAGFAKGLGIDVIWTCHEEDKEKIHFDIRQYNCIFWKDPQDLKERLINRIEAELPNRAKSS